MLIDISTSSPPYKVLQQKAAEELKKRMGGKPSISRLIEATSNHSGISERYIVISDAENINNEKFYSDGDNYLNPGTQKRMEEYKKWAVILAREAVAKLIEKNNVNPQKINRLITISCTGFFAPGLDYDIISEFKIPQRVKRTNIGFMGCAASLIGFNSVLEAMNSANYFESNSLLISVELCSLHLQTEPSRDNILANMVFADGCAAALFSTSAEYKPKAKLNLISNHSFLFENSSGSMGWKIGNYGFEMLLSSDLPRIILNEATPVLKNILKEKGIKSEEIDHWALHPGGKAILDVLQKGLEIPDNKMIPSRNVLKNFGNMSSASILFVLKEIINSGNVKKDDNICAVAFGPGLTMEVSLMKGL
jgi:predicted naringenin-chalcone synthase